MEKLQSEGEINADEMDTNLTEAHESMINATEELETLEIEGERNQDGSVKKAHESSIISTTRDPKGEEPFEKLQSEGEVMVDQAQRSNLQTEKLTLEGYEFTSCIAEVEPTYTYGRKKINRTYSRKRKQVSDDCAKQKTLTVMPQAEELKQLKEDEVLQTGHLGKSVEICYGSGKRSYRTEVAGLCCHALQEENLVRSENFLGGSRKKRHELQSEMNTTSLSKNVGVLSHGLQEENLVKSDNDCRGPENRFPKMESGTGYAAIAAGLPPHSLSVEETIRFGSVLKQTSTLKNYLKHR